MYQPLLSGMAFFPTSHSTTNITVCNDDLPFTWNNQTYTAAGTYAVTLTAASGCDSIATLVLTVETTPPGIRYPTLTTAPNVALPLQGRTLGNNYLYAWSPATGLDLSTVKNPVFNFDKTTEYLIRIQSAAGCVTIDTQLVKVADPITTPEAYVPRAWTPNNDGYNDRLYPLTVNVTQLYYFRIYNRWGQLVFETKILNQGWDGTYKGQPMIADVYTWIMEAMGIDGTIIKKTGESVLLR